MSHLWSIALRACLQAFDALGIDSDEVCDRVGIQRETLDDVDARIPLATTNAIWPVAVELHGPDVGVQAGAVVPFGAYEALDYVFASAPTIDAAIDSFTRCFVVVTEGLTRFDVTPNETGGVRLTFSGPVGMQIRGYGLACVASRLRRFGASIERVTLTRPPVSDASAYRAAFAAPVRFGTPADALHIAATSLKQSIAPTLQGLRPVVLRELDDLIAGLDQDRTMQQVQGAILRHLTSGTPTLTDTAARLHVSPRTLQRRLSDRGVTFTDVLDQTRAALARAHLAEPDLSVTEIGYMLGFSDPSAFTRAFVRWFDMSPSQFRDESCAWRDQTTD
jgi:AraC-like DNA-binding protein